MTRWRSLPFAATRTWGHQISFSDESAVSNVMRPAVHQEVSSRSGAFATMAVHAAAPVPRSCQPLAPSLLDTHQRVRPMSIERFSCSSRHIQMPSVSFDAPVLGQKHELTGHRRLVNHHHIDPVTTRILPESSSLVPPIHHESTLAVEYSQASRYFDRQMAPSYLHADCSEQPTAKEATTSIKKRQRVVIPDDSPRRTSYESKYGLTCSETSKLRMRSRCDHSAGFVEEGSVCASQNRYVEDKSTCGMKKVDFPIKDGSALDYSGNEQVTRTTASAATDAPVSAVSAQPSVKKKFKFSFPSTPAFQSKEFLMSNTFVRNLHGEVDWVATFLNVGFDSHSIYALMCPLRKGRWKMEEESYAMGLLQLIESGTILLRHGQSIRGYIGKKLHSDDMRVLKKLSNCKMFWFAKSINPRLAAEEDLDVSAAGARQGLQRLEQLRCEFLRSVQLEALVAVRKHLSDSSLRELLSVGA
ncbi:unnamed protein product [Hyaloperonospora brassicae]|uniref:Uncharacterized protein n=1 Tax=Hyaloperonospora brassicae TaxID=162125 RepID=A0AAV0UEC1_HYABA|nr:unnamed protein product [Hyaloperonospora brassicae]